MRRISGTSVTLKIPKKRRKNLNEFGIFGFDSVERAKGSRPNNNSIANMQIRVEKNSKSEAKGKEKEAWGNLHNDRSIIATCDWVS